MERRSHVHFMDQYLEPWRRRIWQSTLNAVTDFPQFSPGWQRWDERAFHPDADGVMRSLSELWPDGKAPLALMTAIRVVRLGGPAAPGAGRTGTRASRRLKSESVVLPLVGE